MPARHLYHPDLLTVNRTLTEQSRDNVANRLLIGQIATVFTMTTFPGQFEVPRTFVIARYPYNPAYHVWTRMVLRVEASDLNASIALTVAYTINNFVSTTTLDLEADLGDNICGGDWNEIGVDLTGITAATWIGVVVTPITTGGPTKPIERAICRATVYLEGPLSLYA